VDVSVLLVSVSQSEVLWSRNYAVTLRDGYYVEDEIATTILEGVRAALDRDTPAGGWRLKVEIGEH
jgi:TolB-like protein